MTSLHLFRCRLGRDFRCCLNRRNLSITHHKHSVAATESFYVPSSSDQVNRLQWFLSRQSFGPKFCVVWPWKTPASGWGSLWSRPHSFLGFPRLCSGMFPERFRNASLSVGSREIRLIWTEHIKCETLPAELLRQFISDSALNLFRNLCDIFLVNSRNGRVSWLAVPRIFLLCFSCKGWKLSFVSHRCLFWRENATQLWRLN